MIILPAIFKNMRSRVDKTWTLTFETNELTPEQLSELGRLLSEFCYMALKREPFKEKEEDIIKGLQSEIDFTGKSPSQRLRAAIYRMWENHAEGYTDSNLHYVYYMEKLITYVKNKIEVK